MHWESRPDDRIVRLMPANHAGVANVDTSTRSLAARLSFYSDVNLDGEAVAMLRRTRQDALSRRACGRREGRAASLRRRPSRFGHELPRGVYRTRVSEMRSEWGCVGVPSFFEAAGRIPIGVSCALGAVMLPLRGG